MPTSRVAPGSPSRRPGPPARSRTLASPDVATCADCLRELRDPADRRYRHPFITCTNCGPRFTIITALPYDRDTTTMAGFPMCAACRREYEDPADRRFHAQPIACPDCGPRLELVTGDPAGTAGRRCTARPRCAPPGSCWRPGRIVAVKGLGGYHLACDARNADAVAELRRRKRRGGKPFAVMVADLDAARRLVTLTDGEERLLTGIRSGRSCWLVPGASAAGVADAVAPDNPDLGVMLPYTPLHELLFGLAGDPPVPDALVMTSGNVSGEPIVTDDAEALTRLARSPTPGCATTAPIQVPCDDSVSRHVGGVPLPVRRSRGYAPLPLALPFEVPPTLAAGADLKNTCAVAERPLRLAQPAHRRHGRPAHRRRAHRGRSGHLSELTGRAPRACSSPTPHPGYRSTPSGPSTTPTAGRCAASSTTTRTSPR